MGTKCHQRLAQEHTPESIGRGQRHACSHCLPEHAPEGFTGPADCPVKTSWTGHWTVWTLDCTGTEVRSGTGTATPLWQYLYTGHTTAAGHHFEVLSPTLGGNACLQRPLSRATGDRPWHRLGNKTGSFEPLRYRAAIHRFPAWNQACYQGVTKFITPPGPVLRKWQRDVERVGPSILL